MILSLDNSLQNLSEYSWFYIVPFLSNPDAMGHPKSTLLVYFYIPLCVQKDAKINNCLSALKW